MNRVTNPIHDSNKNKIKCLGINLIKEISDFCTENYKTLTKEIEEDTKKCERHLMFMD